MIQQLSIRVLFVEIEQGGIEVVLVNEALGGCV
jgi:hypothetical protein